MASLLKKGGAGKSLPGECTEDAAKAVQGAISQLAEKYGVDLDANAKAAWKEEEKREAALKGNVKERYDQAAIDFLREEERKKKGKGSGKFISQETFDDVVTENIEDFEMEPEEALADAIEQFQAQNIDLSNIVKVIGGAKSGPIPELLSRLETCTTVEEACQIMGALKTATENNDENYLIATTNDASGVVFGTVGRLDKGSIPLVSSALTVFAALQKYPLPKGIQQIPIYPVAKPVLRMVFETKSLKDDGLWALACRVARWGCSKNEAAKHSMFTEYGLDGHIRTALRRGLGWSDDMLSMTGASHEYVTKKSKTKTTTEDKQSLTQGEAKPLLLREACMLLSCVLNDDDRRQGVQPNTFARGRLFGDGKKVATTCIGEVVEALSLASNEVENNKNEDQEEVKKFAGDVAVAIRCLAVTDEICADFTERGATENLIKLMDAYGEDPRVCSRCCLALKMISNNDANKRTLVLKGGLDVILRAMSNHSINVNVQSQCLATLSSIGLRQPENCQAIVSKHGVPLILTAMQRLPNAVNVQRSACLVLRNLVSRNKEHVDVILGCGAEDLCRAARQRHPACNDVAFAALRDLGCASNYKKPEQMEKDKKEAEQARKGFRQDGGWHEDDE